MAIWQQAFALMTALQICRAVGVRPSKRWSIWLGLAVTTCACSMEQAQKAAEGRSRWVAQRHPHYGAMGLQSHRYKKGPQPSPVPRRGSLQTPENWKVGNGSCTSCGSGFIVLLPSLPDLRLLGSWSHTIFIFVPYWTFDRCATSVTEELGTESYPRYFKHIIF